jgi:hypothetical protein
MRDEPMRQAVVRSFGLRLGCLFFLLDRFIYEIYIPKCLELELCGQIRGFLNGRGKTRQIYLFSSKPNQDTIRLFRVEMGAPSTHIIAGAFRAEAETNQKEDGWHEWCAQD